jgi:hypothetical protein
MIFDLSVDFYSSECLCKITKFNEFDRVIPFRNRKVASLGRQLFFQNLMVLNTFLQCKDGEISIFFLNGINEFTHSFDFHFNNIIRLQPLHFITRII